MGITYNIAEFERNTLRSFGCDFSKLRICELGNQGLEGFDGPAKKFYLSNLGVADHVSIDLNSRDGALQVDLDHPFPDFLLNRFNLVTNYGTIEHVNNQYQVFRNIHDACRKNGLMIHAFNTPGEWPGHGRFYHSEKFVKELAKACNYRILAICNIPCDRPPRKKRQLLMVAFQKTGLKGFIPQKTFDRFDLLDTGKIEKNNKLFQQ